MYRTDVRVGARARAAAGAAVLVLALVGSAALSAVARAATAPTNTVQPHVSGEGWVGSTLTTTTGTWNGSPDLYQYQWYHCMPSGAGCMPSKVGTDAPSYVVQSGDVGGTVYVYVSAHNSSGWSQGVVSNTIGPITATAPGPDRPPGLVPTYITEHADSAHFVVHYTSSAAHPSDQLSTADANALLDRAEIAYSYYVDRWGFPPPLDDGDGKTDIYVFNIPIGPAAGRDSSTSDQSSGFVVLGPASVNQYAIAHELFHVIQFGIYTHTGFFSESSAEWAGQAVSAATGRSPPPNWFPDPWVPLDCVGSGCGDAGGYRGSIFWEYLSERFGMGIAREAYDHDAALAAAAGDHQPHDLQALSDVLAAHGSSLADAFNGYALAAVAGQITRPGVLPHLPAASAEYGASLPITYTPRTVSVDHLSLKRIAFVGGDPGDAFCDAATLHLQVDLPAGVPTRPFFVTYPPSGQPPATAVYSLAISGGRATADVPWKLCTSQLGSLTLPNASSASDGQVFTVHVTVTQPTPPSRPVLSQLKLSPNQFRAAARGASTTNTKRPPAGATVSYRDTQAAVVRFTVKKAATGVQQGRSCVPRTDKNKKRRQCTRWITLRGSFTHHDRAGRNSFRFSGRLNRRALMAGSYRLYATPTVAQLTGGTIWAPFRIVR